jgi:hypothetical protein
VLENSHVEIFDKSQADFAATGGLTPMARAICARMRISRSFGDEK